MQKETSPDRHLLKRRSMIPNQHNKLTLKCFLYGLQLSKSLELYKFQFQQHPIFETKSVVLKLSSRMALTVMCLGQTLVSIALQVREAISLRKRSKNILAIVLSLVTSTLLSNYLHYQNDKNLFSAYFSQIIFL